MGLFVPNIDVLLLCNQISGNIAEKRYSNQKVVGIANICYTLAVKIGSVQLWKLPLSSPLVATTMITTMIIIVRMAATTAATILTAVDGILW